MGHEYGHYFDYWYPRLCDDKTGEAGGMAEGHADIMGLLTEVYGKYTANTPDSPATTFPESALDDPDTWILGEKVAKSGVNGGKGLRFFVKPSWDTDEGARDAWQSDMASVEVHAAAGPTDRMFYYLAVGAPSSPTHPGYTSYLPKGSAGVGLHKAARIWVRAMTSGQLATWSKHTNARTACISAANALYGTNSPEAAAVMNAYAGVNVGQPAGTVSISPSTTTMYPSVYQLFKASILGTNSTAVTWSCTGGSVDSTGNYKAPWVSSPRTYKVRATSVADSSKFAEATVMVNPSSTITCTEVEPNNSSSAANVVPDTATKISGTMSSNTDLDFFRINVAAGRTVTVNMTGPSGSDYDLFLLNGAGTVLKRSESSTCTESVTYQNSGSTTATYFVKVTRDSGSSSTNAYTLSLLR
jgi:hypothetical protein